MKTRACSSILVTTLFALTNTAPVLAQEQRQIADRVTGKEVAAKQHLSYKLIDLGTFGGPSSYLATTNQVTGPGAINQVLNNQGTVAGWGETSATDPFSPNCLGFDCSLPLAFQRQKGVLSGLPLLPGGDGSTAAWISDNGLIAGQARNGLVDPLLPGMAEVRAVLWKAGEVIDLGTLSGNESGAFSVNNRGQVVGVATNTIPDPFSFFATQLRAFLWQDGAMQDLGTLGGPEAFALFVNERGQVAGIATTNSLPNSLPSGSTFCGLRLTTDPFLWENGRMTDLGTLGGTCGTPFALNNRGQVIGMSDLAGELGPHPFLWDRGSLIDLGTFGGSYGFAFGINDSGEVVGFASNKNDQAELAFLWKDGVMTNLGTLDGDDCSHAFQINSKGQIAGISFPCAGGPPRLVLWRNGFMTDLSVFAPLGSTLTPWFDGAVINERGEIAGLRVLPDGDLHAFLLVPCEKNTDSCVDAVEGAAATPNIPARSAATPATSMQRRLTPAAVVAAWRARLVPQ